MADNDNVVQFPKAAREDNQGRLLIPERLVEARLAKRLNQTELANAVGVTRQAISSYELGTKKPDPSTMAGIAAQLGQPIGFFTSAGPGTFGPASANFYRKVGADTKRRNAACGIYANWLGQTAFAFNSFVNYPAPAIPSFEPKSPDNRYSDEEIEEIAESVREHFGLGLGPITNVVRLMESKGIIVCRVAIEKEKIEAFSFWRGEKPFVFLASEKDSAVRSRMDAAHELGHLCMHRWIGAEEIEDEKTLKAIEKEADRFAGAFLLPRQSFSNEIYSPRLLAFLDLKSRWKVSIQAMVYRCKTLGIFDEQQVTNLYKQISAKKWRTSEPLDGEHGIPFEQPLLLKRVAEMVLDAGKIRRDELKGTLGFSAEWIEKLTGLPEGALADGAQEIDVFPTLK